MAHQGAGKAALAAVLVSGAARDPAAARSGILPAAAAVRPDLGVPARRAADVAGFLAPPRRDMSRARVLEACFIPAVSSKARDWSPGPPAGQGVPARPDRCCRPGADTERRRRDDGFPECLRFQRRADGRRPAPVMPGNRKEECPHARHLGLSAGD